MKIDWHTREPFQLPSHAHNTTKVQKESIKTEPLRIICLTHIYKIYIHPSLSLSLSSFPILYLKLISIPSMATRRISPSSFHFIALCILLLQSSFIIVSSVVLVLRNHHSHNGHHRNPILQANQSSCALFMGSWVRDETYPVYQYSCPIIDPQFNCQMYGRPDTDYLKYRWQPANCQIPR